MILPMRYQWRECFVVFILVWVVIDMAVPQGFATAYRAQIFGQFSAPHRHGDQGSKSSQSETDCFCAAHVMPAKVAVVSTTVGVIAFTSSPGLPSFEGYLPRLDHPPRA